MKYGACRVFILSHPLQRRNHGRQIQVQKSPPVAATAHEETTGAGLTGARYPGGGALCGLSAWHLRDRLCLSQNRLPSGHISALAVNDIEGLDLALSRCSVLRHTARSGSHCRRHAGEPRREGAESEYVKCAHPGATI